MPAFISDLYATLCEDCISAQAWPAGSSTNLHQRTLISEERPRPWAPDTDGFLTPSDAGDVSKGIAGDPRPEQCMSTERARSVPPSVRNHWKAGISLCMGRGEAIELWRCGGKYHIYIYGVNPSHGIYKVTPNERQTITKRKPTATTLLLF